MRNIILPRIILTLKESNVCSKFRNEKYNNAQNNIDSEGVRCL